jgi:hypothetical protein
MVYLNRRILWILGHPVKPGDDIIETIAGSNASLSSLPDGSEPSLK